ncbi:hypothetical protein SAMN02745824_2014 [Parasphingorhabdus marina DSM 22363]|uniref:Uncharacterized protein n=1 Tax=Parasphingorhabdus marina DSM 22363 TaxID=1123272 RepID=A0A1N6ENT3_9SPHN|nr:hypothetical protein [Parasphingorhabdus marina]SIN84603.1 hypothetical protein SAMN02745824_2014 [Parasphingorhabdus marina DSM 22363]
MLQTKRSYLAIGSALLLASCGVESDLPESDESSSTANATSETIVAADGLQLRAAGEAELISLPFGTPMAKTVSAVSAQTEIEGIASANDECGAGPMQFVTFGDLKLNFQDEAFVGWFIDGASPIVKTPEAVGIGSIRETAVAQMPIVMQPDSTLGNEFLSDRGADGFIGGFLSGTDGNAVVESLYAGTNCFFR